MPYFTCSSPATSCQFLRSDQQTNQFLVLRNPSTIYPILRRSSFPTAAACVPDSFLNPLGLDLVKQVAHFQRKCPPFAVGTLTVPRFTRHCWQVGVIRGLDSYDLHCIYGCSNFSLPHPNQHSTLPTYDPLTGCSYPQVCSWRRHLPTSLATVCFCRSQSGPQNNFQITNRNAAWTALEDRIFNPRTTPQAFKLRLCARVHQLIR